jgi:hypothetical protein
MQKKKTFLKEWYSQQNVKRALTQCESHPDSDTVCKLLSGVDNFEFGDEITDRQWVTTDLSALMTTVVPCEEFID